MKKYIFKDDGINGIKIVSYDYKVVDKKEVQTSQAHTVRLYPDHVFKSKDPKKIKDFAAKAWTDEIKQAYAVQQEALKPTAEQLKAEAKANLKAKCHKDLESMQVEVNSKLFDVPMSRNMSYEKTIKHLKDDEKTYWTVTEVTDEKPLETKSFIEVTKEELITALDLGEKEGLRIMREYHSDKSKV